MLTDLEIATSAEILEINDTVVIAGRKEENQVVVSTVIKIK